ncbi:orotidine-5'-phosphate decarboxylase [Gilvimarinus sp. F26214L]|uniref:orotidine-5'-phosphate decarboxylase n=1 Tax=Gilvimarinus sp. DZF01 TaxID=3461371 RepID=UPI004045C1C9
MSKSPLIVALDFDSVEACTALVEQLDPGQVRLKVGNELFTRAGPGVVEQLQYRGFEVFLDLKYHDIPNTVAQAARAAADLGVWMVNVHASGGERMMTAAREALEPFSQRPLLIAVTVLTSMARDDLEQAGVARSPDDQVLALAGLARQCGLDGVVCSAREAPILKSELGKEFTLVTPGIRPAGTEAADQRRTMTPPEAAAAGSDFLVIGRPITAARDPGAACQDIIRSLQAGV